MQYPYTFNTTYANLIFFPQFYVILFVSIIIKDFLLVFGFPFAAPKILALQFLLPLLA